MSPKRIAILLVIFGLNFGIQSLNLLKLEFCDFYLFHPKCATWYEVLVNKFLRLGLNFLCLILIGIPIKRGLPIINGIIILLLVLYFYLFFSTLAWGEIGVKILNPLLFSPLIPIALLASLYLQKET